MIFKNFTALILWKKFVNKKLPGGNSFMLVACVLRGKTMPKAPGGQNNFFLF